MFTARTLACAFLFCLAALPAEPGSQESGQPGLFEKPADALKNAAEDKKPILILIQNTGDIGSLDAGYWLTSDSSLKDALPLFHVVKVWNIDPFLKTLPLQNRSGLVFLTFGGKPITAQPIPMRRDGLRKLLLETVLLPITADEMLEAARAKHAPEIFARAIDAMRKTGRSSEALAFLLRENDAELLKSLDLKKVTAELEVETAPAMGECLKNIFGLYQNIQQKHTLLATWLPDLKDWSKWAGDMHILARRKYCKEYPDEVQVRLREMFMALNKIREKGNEEKVCRIAGELLARPMDAQDCANSASALLYVTMRLDLLSEQALLAKKVEAELGSGRHAADVYLDLADEAFARGEKNEADHFWKLAEKAAGHGESPVLYATAQSTRALAEGEDSPRRTKWANREVLDVVVLAPDLATFAAAIAQWTPKRFFPVLFQDDLYAPKFITAFKPARVLVLRPNAEKCDQLSWDKIRGTILLAWLESDKKRAAKTDSVSDDQLRARLHYLNAKPLGVVFGDGVSGETAGALALAAGRFQGFEFLERPRVGKDKVVGDVDNYMAYETALEMDEQVREGLARWDLPYKNHWAAITLAGRYPFRYCGEKQRASGNVFALDDMLGRSTDLTRIACVGRLLGSQAQSAYQAACSLFLRPPAALLFNTYGVSKNVYSFYGRMERAEKVLSGVMNVTHLAGGQANLGSFRSNLLPWNREKLLVITSSGYCDSWSIDGGPGTTEDIPIGEPCAIHITHSGSAAELYNLETLAARAIWGGAFWYFGSMAEPYLDAFQPASYSAPRIAAGAMFASIFRQRGGQPHWQPWRLMIVGDPQFCLREKPAKRKAASAEDLAALPPGEFLQAGGLIEESAVEAADWTAALRKARWLGDHAAALRQLEKMPAGTAIDAVNLPMILEEYLIASQPADALKAFLAASAEARQNYGAQIYARYSASVLMDSALTAKNVAELCERFTDLLATHPANNFVARWVEQAGALAKEKKEEEAFTRWLDLRAQDTKLEQSFKIYFVNEVLKRKSSWNDEDKRRALENFRELAALEAYKERLSEPLRALKVLYLAKVANSSLAQFKTELKALFKPDSEEAGLIEAQGEK